MNKTTVVIIGAGQAGLAMSRCLTDLSIDHVLLERGSVAGSWRTERWDSLRLLTPNWLSRLPGWSYDGADPDGYMTASQVGDYLDRYRSSFDAPVEVNTTVVSVQPSASGFVLTTDQRSWSCRAVVVASGACSTPRIPAVAAQLPAGIEQLAPVHYRNPDQVGDGGVLVVGPSASGAQIADELARAGRPVTLAVGEHVRLPRTYRGMDIHWWMDTIGQLDERYGEMPDLTRARSLPSLQLIGSPEKRTLDLNALAGSGVRFVGRLVGISGARAQFSGSFANVCAAADLKQGRLLDLIDEFATENGLDDELDEAPWRPAPTSVPAPPTELPVESFDTVLWATGFRPRYPWLDDSLLDRKGAIVHEGGVMDQPGMYVLGLPFMRRRKSSFLDGVGPDALELSSHLHDFLSGHQSRGGQARSEPIQLTASA